MLDLSINLGEIFLISTPIKPHYFVSIAKINDNKYLFVSFITKKPKSELACVFKPSYLTPSFIVRETVIDYKSAKELNLKQLKIAVGDNSFRECCRSEILKQIQQGGLRSKRLKNKYKNILKNIIYE